MKYSRLIAILAAAHNLFCLNLNATTFTDQVVVTDASSGRARLTLEDSGDGTNAAYLNFRDTSSGTYWHLARRDNVHLDSDFLDLTFYNGVSFTTALRLHPEGRVGIGGTFSPTQMLDVNGAVAIRGLTTGTNSLLLGTTTNNGNYLAYLKQTVDENKLLLMEDDDGRYFAFSQNGNFKINSNGGDTFIHDSNGYVGIGTHTLQLDVDSSSLYRLTVRQTVNETPVAYFEDDDGNYFDFRRNGALAIKSNAGGTFIHTHDGRVGLGTFTPSAGKRLHVVGAALVDGDITSTGTISAANFVGDGSQLTGLGGGNIFSAGANVGIGTPAPQSTLVAHSTSNVPMLEIYSGNGNIDMGKDLKIESYHPSMAFVDRSTNATGGVIHYNSPSIRFGKFNGIGDVVDSVTVNTNTGNVGIGTSSPSAKLDVIGDMEVSGIDLHSNTRSSHLEKDGTLYRHSDGQMYLTVDDYLRVRDATTGNVAFEFNTNTGELRVDKLKIGTPQGDIPMGDFQ